ncbi:general secretion family protein [Dehalogenimonas lykanthroporepellens BL-DC-9]|nr:general secretion family protein [Dehalogenimonas lykanthroporepellens BL-DC-9]
MDRFFKRFKSGQRGFTLIELLVVVAILGTISAVAMPNVLQFMNEGDTQAALAEQHNLQVAAAVYAFENGGTLPTSVTDHLRPHLVNDPQFTWTITDGAVVPATGNNPLLET